MKEMKLKHEKEVADLVQASNEKYQLMLVEQLQAQDFIRSSMHKEMNEGTAFLPSEHNLNPEMTLSRIRLNP